MYTKNGKKYFTDYIDKTKKSYMLVYYIVDLDLLATVTVYDKNYTTWLLENHPDNYIYLGEL